MPVWIPVIALQGGLPDETHFGLLADNQSFRGRHYVVPPPSCRRVKYSTRRIGSAPLALMVAETPRLS